MSEPTDLPDGPDRTAKVLAVVLLLAMVVFNIVGDRDDKAWKAMTDPVKSWVKDLRGG